MFSTKDRIVPKYFIRRRGLSDCISVLVVAFSVVLFARAQGAPPKGEASASHKFFIDCSGAAGDGSLAHPWNSLAAAEAHPFVAGDVVALARGTVCREAFAPKGSGSAVHPIRLTAYGHGRRPRIVAPHTERQILLLFNQQYWQVDSLDLSGASKYGIYVSGDEGPLNHIYLKNLYVHHVLGGPMKNKDNGLIIVGPGSAKTVFNDVLVDGVDVAHTNQWSGVMLGGGNFAWASDAPLNRKIVIRNSTAHDVFGDGLILFRDQDGLIVGSAAWQIGMEPTQDVGTPNAIWTWTCIDCTVEDNEAYLTDSPGVDGGAYDIDWDNTRNIVQRNYAHDTQGYCVAVFAAGYVTSDSQVHDNLCINNGLSPRLAALQGAVYVHTWNDGPIRGLRFEHNTIEWNPPFAGAAAVVSDALFDGPTPVFTKNQIVSSSPYVYRTTARWETESNVYRLPAAPLFTAEKNELVSLQTLQDEGQEKGSVYVRAPLPDADGKPLRIDATLKLDLDADELIAPAVRAQLLVLRDLAGEYGPEKLSVTVHLAETPQTAAVENALGDLEAIYPGALRFDRDAAQGSAGVIQLSTDDGKKLRSWHGFQNAASLGAEIRARLGAPRYAHMQPLEAAEEK